MTPHNALPFRPAALAAALLLAACGGSDDGGYATEPEPPVAEETREHDSRVFTPDVASTTFAALTADAGDQTNVANTSRWAGVIDGAAYRVEVPANWNGRLVMYAHGYAGNGPDLAVQNPSIRRHLIDNGYAWAASSYHANYYDVRAGVEDTNALALAFNRIAESAGRPLAAPDRIYIIGHSMGGHIAGAAVEAETLETAVNKVAYHGAVPMCGVMGDTALFNTFGAVQTAAQVLAGVPDHPTADWTGIVGQVTATLFSSFPNPAAPQAQIAPTTAGLPFVSALQNLTGGARPMFDLGLAFGGSFPYMWGNLGGDGTITGILNKNVLDTRDAVYTIDGQPDASAALNAAVQRLVPEADANRLRTDGLRWIPQVAGSFSVPVVTIHTLGDLFVPFNMQQVYAQRAAANGSSGMLVQRAIRGVSHCDFTTAEQVRAFEDMVAWEQGGDKPAGDDVLDAATVGASDYGCRFTNNTLGVDDSSTTRALRPTAAALRPCPAS
ncbi:MAG: alpha/beta hydrolase [Burkholderiaceae bacterium]|nr:alpha/beta hydrolase [Burkholderiaceae bacterium]